MGTVAARKMLRGFVGALVGAIVGAIVAVNFVIAFGPDSGYESSIPDVFRENVLVGIVTVAILVAGPMAGAIVAGRMRRAPSAGGD